MGPPLNIFGADIQGMLRLGVMDSAFARHVFFISIPAHYLKRKGWRLILTKAQNRLLTALKNVCADINGGGKTATRAEAREEIKIKMQEKAKNPLEHLPLTWSLSALIVRGLRIHSHFGAVIYHN
jgi:hypothetical protein